MIHSKPAKADYSIIPVIGNRWSPVSFSDQPVEKKDNVASGGSALGTIRL